jgi:hypothetical protein
MQPPPCADTRCGSHWRFAVDDEDTGTRTVPIAQVTSDFLLNIIAYNLIRIPKLIAA